MVESRYEALLLLYFSAPIDKAVLGSSVATLISPDELLRLLLDLRDWRDWRDWRVDARRGELEPPVVD